MKDSQKILTTVQFVLGQLDEAFDLQRFIELVEQEKWDEEAAIFIAFRQTILTMLVSSPDDDDLRERFSTYRTIVMELDDPVLLSAGLVPVLMDMAVHEFLSVETETRKLIVLDNAQEYLFTNSILTKSLASLASMSAGSPANVLLIATDPKRVNPSLYFHFDFLLLGHFNVHSVRWKKSLLSHLQIPSFMRDNGDTKLMQVRPNQCAIYSPNSIRMVSYSQQSGEEKEEAALWDETPILIELDDLVSVGLSPVQKLKVEMARSAIVPVVFQRTKSGQGQATLEWLATEHTAKSGEHEERQEQSEPEFVNPLLSPAATNVGPVENVKKENGTRWINGAPSDPTTSKTSVSAFLSNEIILVGAPPTALPTQNQLAATVQNVKDKDPQPFSALESPILPREEMEERGLHETRIYHPTDYDPKYRELVSAILCVTNGRINVKARYPKVLRVPIFKEDIGNSDGNRQHDEHDETRKPITIPYCETRVAESRELAWDDGVVQFGRDSEGVWVILNSPRQPLRLSYERGGVTFEEQRIKAEGKLVKEQEPPSTPPSMTRATETTEESRKEKKGLDSTNKGKELRPETMRGSAITEEEAMKAVPTSTEFNLLHTSVVKSLNSGENELSGIPIVPTVTEPENEDITPAAIFTRSIGEQKMPEVPLSVPNAPSISTSINFEPLRFAIRQVGGSEGQAVISLLSPPLNWKQESKFTRKWKKYIVAAVEAGVVVWGEINSEPYLRIRADKVESAEISASSHSAPPRAAQPVPQPVPVPVPVPAPRPHPVPKTAEKVISYLPLHAAIWRTCDVGERALVSRIGSGMADGWKTGSGFGGTLEEYIEAAIDARKVVRGGKGSKAWLKIYTGVPENGVHPTGA
ncbi:hypothetical protein FRC18_003271 [Serendipita sp. 400]|nr:hypothetical protein FRC18_003271 [Serendipita sp. 400]